MNRIYFLAAASLLGVLSIGCDTGLTGPYRNYEPATMAGAYYPSTPARRLTPAPDAETAGYHAGPTTAPTSAASTTAPTD